MASELEEALHSLARRFGPAVLDDPDGLGPLLDDLVVAREEQVRAQVVVDAVRLGSWQRLRELRSHGAAEVAALDSAAEHLTEARGGTDHASARWALSMLGHAAGVLSASTAAPMSGPLGGRSPGGPAPAAPTVGPLAPTAAPHADD